MMEKHTMKEQKKRPFLTKMDRGSSSLVPTLLDKLLLRYSTYGLPALMRGNACRPVGTKASRYRYIQAALSAVLLLIFLLPVYATELNAERYIQIEIAAREAAVAGARSRLEQSGNASTTRQARKLSEQTHQSISQVYRRAGISPGAALAWENRHRKSIKTWLNNRPDTQQHYDDLNDELNDLSRLIDAAQRP